jgi:hypothetical protein
LDPFGFCGLKKLSTFSQKDFLTGGLGGWLEVEGGRESPRSRCRRGPRPERRPDDLVFCVDMACYVYGCEVTARMARGQQHHRMRPAPRRAVVHPCRSRAPKEIRESRRAWWRMAWPRCQTRLARAQLVCRDASHKRTSRRRRARLMSGFAAGRGKTSTPCYLSPNTQQLLTRWRLFQQGKLFSRAEAS